MDRGAWRATARGVARVGRDLETKQPPPPAARSVLASVFLSFALWVFTESRKIFFHSCGIFASVHGLSLPLSLVVG